MPTPVLLAAVAAASAAVVTDVRQRRIPNWLTGGVLVVGGVANVYLFGIQGGLSALAGAALGFGMLIPFYAIHAMGAGDVKLLAAIGALLGPRDLVSVAVYGAIVGGFLSIAALAQRGVLVRAWQQVLVLQRPPTLRTGIKTPYAVAIAGGVYLALLLPPVVG